jgi:hypothetical protein
VANQVVNSVSNIATIILPILQQHILCSCSSLGIRQSVTSVSFELYLGLSLEYIAPAEFLNRTSAFSLLLIYDLYIPLLIISDICEYTLQIPNLYSFLGTRDIVNKC